jgi:hypothetical protein
MALRLGWTAAAAFLLCLAPAVAFGDQIADSTFDATVPRPAFKDKHPLVVFDTAHHNLFTAFGRLKPFGVLAIGNGMRVVEDNHKISTENLQPADILVIADALGARNPLDSLADHSALTDAECDAVRDWVRGGKSLLLIAEHAPMGAAARSLAKRFGVDLGNGYLSDPTLSDTTIGLTTLVFSRANGSLGDHAITRGRDTIERVTRVKTYTGESISAPEGSTVLLRVSDAATEVMLQPKFGGIVPDSAKKSAKGRAQGIALTFGKGRVVVLGEAAMLSAQRVDSPDRPSYKVGLGTTDADNRQFALNLLNWLGHALN